jgi:hypothetical protein
MTVIVHMVGTLFIVSGVLTVIINLSLNNGGAAMSGVCLFLAGIVWRWSNE